MELAYSKPRIDGPVETTGYQLKLEFKARDIPTQKKAFDFARVLCDSVVFEKIELGAHGWRFSIPLGGTANKPFVIGVGGDWLAIDVPVASQSQGWYAQRFALLIDRLRETLRVEQLLNCRVRLVCELQIQGDARTYMASEVMGMDPARLGAFRRPLHMVGLRLHFPAVRDVATNGGSFHGALDLRVESSLDDPKKIRVETEAAWNDCGPWSDQTTSVVLGQLAAAREFLEQNVARFLTFEAAQAKAGEIAAPRAPALSAASVA